ncbi:MULTISPECIES: hypothetical protein [Chryseobacterium]|uniref:hypothetical protein n=1 Tax=Chryseobacterium TaxID=59732 RepID=UPI000EBFF788|nr:MULTISPECIES: hypothetical protein [Chryseobacterium]HCM34647.1 hypothetical protein [Chryseobacterium sp.]
MKIIIKYILVRFIILAIPYFAWFALFAEAGYHRQTYDLDLLPLYVFFFFGGLIGTETLFRINRKEKAKYLSNILLLIFFILLYFVLPHRENFN